MLCEDLLCLRYLTARCREVSRPTRFPLLITCLLVANIRIIFSLLPRPPELSLTGCPGLGAQQSSPGSQPTSHSSCSLLEHISHRLHLLLYSLSFSVLHTALPNAVIREYAWPNTRPLTAVSNTLGKKRIHIFGACSS